MADDFECVTRNEIIYLTNWNFWRKNFGMKRECEFMMRMKKDTYSSGERKRILHKPSRLIHVVLSASGSEIPPRKRAKKVIGWSSYYLVRRLLFCLSEDGE